MSVIYLTGDCHQDFSRLNMHCFPEQKEMKRDDLVVIAGDSGIIWAKNKNATGRGGWKDEQNTIKWLSNKSFKTLFVDGNHEQWIFH